MSVIINMSDDRVNKAKLILAAAAVIAGAAVYYFFDTLEPSWRWTAIVAGLLLGVTAFFFTTQGKAFSLLLRESKIEVYKVVWPSKSESVQTTVMVIVVVFLAALLLWVLDLSLGFSAARLLGRGA